LTETLGAEPTETATESVALPPGPSQVKSYVLEEVKLPVEREPEVGTPPK